MQCRKGAWAFGLIAKPKQAPSLRSTRHLCSRTIENVNDHNAMKFSVVRFTSSTGLRARWIPQINIVTRKLVGIMVLVVNIDREGRFWSSPLFFWVCLDRRTAGMSSVAHRSLYKVLSCGSRRSCSSALVLMLSCRWAVLQRLRPSVPGSHLVQHHLVECTLRRCCWCTTCLWFLNFKSKACELSQTCCANQSTCNRAE